MIDSERSGENYTSKFSKDGVREVYCGNWLGFNELINTNFLARNKFIYRGQMNCAWELKTTLQRATEKLESKQKNKILGILDEFKYASRGRRGSNPPDNLEKNDWWALAQHHGLFTPLLDWTESPYVAAFFALENEECLAAQYVAVYAFSRLACEQLASSGIDNEIEFIRPLSNENPRLISQRGLFTKTKYEGPIETWVKKHCLNREKAILVKIMIPSNQREIALTSLNRMNVNHLSLFPDLDGASKYCNLKVTLKAY